MSNTAWCDLKNMNFLRLHDYCSSPECKCQKQNTFTRKQFQMEGAGFRNTIKKTFQGSQTSWNIFSKPAVNVAAPFIGMAVSAKTKKNQNWDKLLQIF